MHPVIGFAGRTQVAESRLDQGGHRCAPAGGFRLEPAREWIGDAQRRRPMENHVPSPPHSRLPFATVAEEVFRRYGRRWKPGTLAVNRCYLRNQLLPWFRDRPVAEIHRGEVRRWFAAHHRTPAAADRALPVLSVILRQAEIYGYRPEGTNPCLGIRRYRRPGRERVLTANEIRRLGVALRRARAVMPLVTTIVRLLLLTGCRQSEIRTLRWEDYREGHLFLRDAKTGPRTVWLSRASRGVLDRLDRNDDWVFPAAGSGPMPAETVARGWRRLRAASDLPGVRLHDLRHTYATLAMRRGETVLTVGRLLGHRDAATTLKYIHFADRAAHRAVEAVGRVLAR